MKNILVLIILIIVIVGGIYFKITLTDSDFDLLVGIVGILLFVNLIGLSAYLQFTKEGYHPISDGGRGWMY